MVNIRKIAPLFLFGIYAVIFLHSVVPHIHHSDTAKEEVEHHPIAKHHHHHDLGHHHHHSHAASDWLEVLSSLVHNHEHSDSDIDVADEYTLHNKQVVIQMQLQLFTPLFSTTVYAEKTSLSLLDISLFIERPPILYEDILVSADPLRGPPLS